MSAATRLSTFTNDGLTFDVIDEGPLDGPVIVALHGFPERADSWSGVIPILTAAGFRVLAPDQRGYSPGARPKGVRNYTLDKLAGDILALADQAEVPKFHVLGHDWGAAVAWQLAGQHADRVITASILSVPHPRAFLAALPRGQILKSWYMLFFQIPWLPERQTTGNGLLVRKLARDMRLSDAKVKETLELAREPGAATATINWYRAMRYAKPSGPGQVQIPTLYVWSTDDAALGRRAAENTAKYVDGPYRFEVLDGVSHWIAAERPSETAALVLEHIKAHTNRAAGL
ncbi:alpha/beta fold hydrolase [Mycobacteroides chelonae]|uniref:alpha/beta fold hydrolase n=1 Tax=Mycobacteroides chelonae TaxID=1774 RepID=UPI003AAF0ACB